MNNPLIINYTPTGMIPTKGMNPNVPITPNEIIEDVIQAKELGITLTHLHARDGDGSPTYKANIYRDIVEGIKKHCPDLVICLSLSGRNFNQLEKRAEPLQLGVDMGSLTLSSLNFPNQASVNSPEMIQALCEEMDKYGTHPELEVFDLGMINYSKYLIKKGFITGSLYYNIIVGNIAGLQCELTHIGNAVAQLPNNALWSIGGIGKSQLSAHAIAIASGGGVRVGLEDNLYYDYSKKTLASNLQLLSRVHRLAEELQRDIMDSITFGNLGFYNKSRNE